MIDGLYYQYYWYRRNRLKEDHFEATYLGMLMTWLACILWWGGTMMLINIIMNTHVDPDYAIKYPFILIACLILVYFLWHKRYNKIIERHEKYNKRKYRFLAIFAIVGAMIYIFIMAYFLWYTNCIKYGDGT